MHPCPHMQPKTKVRGDLSRLSAVSWEFGLGMHWFRHFERKIAKGDSQSPCSHVSACNCGRGYSGNRNKIFVNKNPSRTRSQTTKISNLSSGKTRGCKAPLRSFASRVKRCERRALALAEAESFKINHKWKQSKEDWGRCIMKTYRLGGRRAVIQLWADSEYAVEARRRRDQEIAERDAISRTPDAQKAAFIRNTKTKLGSWLRYDMGGFVEGPVFANLLNKFEQENLVPVLGLPLSSLESIFSPDMIRSISKHLADNLKPP